MFLPYYTQMDGDCQTEVCYSPFEDGHSVVRVETSDAVYGFKTLECMVPGYQVTNVIGFTAEELGYWLRFCRCNAGLILRLALRARGSGHRSWLV